MLIAAALVGGVTAFYFGVRPGVIAAGVALAAFLAAAVIPGAAIWAYVAVGVGVGGVLILGPKRADPTHAAKAMKYVRRGLALVRGRLGGKKDRDGKGKRGGNDRPGPRPWN
jgi:hypothetical protein